jgi:rare lipoprotein A
MLDLLLVYLPRTLVLTLSAGLLLAGCSSTPPSRDQTEDSGSDQTRRHALARAIEPGYKVGQPYQIAGQWYRPEERFDLVQTGVASWYGPGFHGRLTANGELYDMHAFTAAHRTLQLPCVVRVENMENGKSIIVRVNDRGPYVDGRVIDLSRKAAEALDIHQKGLANVRVTVLPSHSRKMAELAKTGANVGSMDDLVADLNISGWDQPGQQGNIQLAAAPSGDLFLQAAVFSVQTNAERARTQLRAIGPVVVTSVQRGDRTLYRVRVGPYVDQTEADAALQRVREVGFEGAHVVARG